MLPLMQTVFLMIFPVHRRGAAMGLIGLVISFAPAIGPALSGYVTEHYSWRLLFFIILPIAVIDIVIGLLCIEKCNRVTETKIRYTFNLLIFIWIWWITIWIYFSRK